MKHLPKDEWQKTIAWSTVVAGCVIRNDEGEYLLVQEIRPKVYGLWNLPAGHVDKDETIEAAAVREVQEETGYTVELGEKLFVYHESVDTPVLHAFTARITGGALAIDHDEILDAGWFSYDQITALRETGKLRVDWVYQAISRVERQTEISF